MAIYAVIFLLSKGSSLTEEVLSPNPYYKIIVDIRKYA